MNPRKKKEIMDDLMEFANAKDKYSKMGKAWKRGYLLYGPPGTGKSTMIAAIANLLKYDIYDVELTAVKTNSDLKKLLIATTSKSIIVIEDIDCSIKLNGKRKITTEEKKGSSSGDEEAETTKDKDDDSEKSSMVILSGLLNSIDGLWSSCVEERIIVFTTNYVVKLDPTLIRRGRMDKHIELSYCCFEALQLLAYNYLNIEWHDLFYERQTLLEEISITPADVAESLMPKCPEDDATTCLENLIDALKAEKAGKLNAKQEAEKASH